jgi:hypothetical protein
MRSTILRDLAGPSCQTSKVAEAFRETPEVRTNAAGVLDCMEAGIMRL